MSEAPQKTAKDFGEPWHEQTGIMNKGVHWLNTEQFNRAVTCVNACAGMSDPAKEILAMREAIKAAAPLVECSRGGHRQLQVETSLAKLQSFIKP